MDVINEVLILFLIMSSGFIARRMGLIDAPFNRGLAEFVLNITMPLMILGAFNIRFDSTMLAMAGQVFFFSVLIHVGSFLASRFFYRKFTGDIGNVLRFTAIFSNCAFMGYPVLQSIYGKPGVFYASIFTVPFMVALWTLGVYLLSGHQGGSAWRKVVFNPGIMAVIVGLIMFIFSWRLPLPIGRACDLLGSTTTPLAMVLIGSMLAEMRLRELMGGWEVYYASLVRLIIVPLLVLVSLFLLGVKGMVLGVCVICSAMPVAANTAAFAEKYRSDALFASRCVFVSTLFSILTIPFFIALVRRIAE